MQPKQLIRDIRFWILIFFLLRLVSITNPPLEVEHNWRQTTVTMVARNYLETDNHLFYPRIDFAGEKTGITGMEFPLLNYLIYLISVLFGYQHWYGRIINLVISSIGLWYFYKLVRRYFAEKAAFCSTIILAVSAWFQFSRKIMPDTFAMSFILAALYYGTNYLESKPSSGGLRDLGAFVILLILGTLSKLPSGYLLVVFLMHFFNRNISIKRKLIFASAALLGLIPAILWYFCWVPFLVEKYGFWHFFMGKDIQQGFGEIVRFLPQTLGRFYDTALKYTGFAAFLLGLVYAILNREKRLLILLPLTLISFAVVVLKAGFNFPHHSYYIIPFVPVMALLAGYGIARTGRPVVILIFLAAISVEGIANQQHDFWIKDRDKYLLTLEAELDKHSDREDLILINSGSFPTPMYFAHRKGWITTNEKILREGYIEELRDKGLKYIVILRSSFGTDLRLEDYKRIAETPDYTIYQP